MSSEGKSGSEGAQDLVQDPVVQRTIERALAPYVGLAPPALLRTMREALEEALTTEEYPLGLVHALRARAAPLSTEERPCEGASAAGSAPGDPASRAGGRGGRERA